MKYQFNISIFIEPSIQTEFELGIKSTILPELEKFTQLENIRFFHIDSHQEPDSKGYSLQIPTDSLTENLKNTIIEELVRLLDQDFQQKYLHFHSILSNKID